jgi:hypothetical protein
MTSREDRAWQSTGTGTGTWQVSMEWGNDDVHT